MKITRVWACCGVYGWSIPWPEWHAVGVYAHPPDDETSYYVYLYSAAGQLDPKVADQIMPGANTPSHMVKVVNLDEHVNRGDGRVHWDSVLQAILAPGG